MQKTTLEQWRMFKAVVDYGGFSQAAQAVHKSQSTVHHAVGKLEESLGTPLFRLEGRKAILTDNGELLLRRGRFLLEEVERIETVAESLSTGVEASLSIAVDSAFPQELVFCVLESISIKFPQLKVEVVETVLSGANEAIAERRATLGISPIMMDSGLNEEICQVEFVAVANQGHPLHLLGRPLTNEDLKTHRQIVVRDSSTGASVSAGWLGSEQRWTVSHMRTSVDLVCKGLGYAWLPLPSIQQYLDEGLLLPLNLERGSRRTVPFYLNYADSDSLGPAARELLGELRYQTMDMPT
ncbi:DNA-binding transcriptional regulator, LysR family [Microbulbifer donghaiensis]|uniref:DNA-binding transcriptional regulator, LysR family n=1 Tax=Microbulbifer donghaiensis TaxID=494016 RepID=A0A1M4UWD0_9GAMM|nr:LysR family transcriptional regulator [Microbulbifer donghaiensis]SHE60910.1 DNA-binding transcriptional regulator, LysR family [Microbulbifer donghaiensis]